MMGCPVKGISMCSKCGSDETLILYTKNVGWVIKCDNCGHKTGPQMTIEDVVKSWEAVPATE